MIVKAFIVGGLFCVVGQFFIDRTKLTPARILVGYVVSGVLLSALGANANGKRTALIYLLVDALGALLFGAVFYTLNRVLHFGFMDMTMTITSVALLNTAFRLLIVLLLSPWIGALEKLVTVLVL